MNYEIRHTGRVEIETDRLILRRFKLSDAQNMFDNYTSRDKVTEYLTWHPHKSIKDTKEYLANLVLPEYDKTSTYRWAIVLKENNQVIGCIDVVSNNDEKRRAELGWVLGNDFWGKGIMPEAGKKVLKHLFSIGYERIEAIHDVENQKSGRVMAKIGMKDEGTLRKYNPNRDDILVDCEMWSIIKE